MNNELASLIISTIKQVQKGNPERTEIYSNPQVAGNHEFLFFLKPEITMQSDTIRPDLIVDMVLEKIEKFQLHIKNAVILPAAYLEKHAIIAQHYGVINAIARDAGNLSSSAKDKFGEHYGIKFSAANVFGGLQLIQSFPAFTPQTVDYLWQNSPTVKLGGGAYCQSLKFDGQLIFLVNGFHPRQLEHFIAPGRSIVAFTLTGNTSWNIARNNLIGKTNPIDAEPGSIRRILLENKDVFGLSAVNSSWNGVHLSAGPVEGLVELLRYNSNFDSDKKLTPSDFSFGRKLQDHFDNNTIEKILGNETINYEGKETNIFDLTEEKDADNSLDLLKKIYK